jgi:hypothetical protein
MFPLMCLSLQAENLLFPAPPAEILPRLTPDETKDLCDSALEESLADPSQGITVSELYDKLMAIDT